MELEPISTLISNVGFPIAVSIALLWIHHNSLKENHKILNELKVAILNNTKTLEHLLNRKN